MTNSAHYQTTVGIVPITPHLGDPSHTKAAQNQLRSSLAMSTTTSSKKPSQGGLGLGQRYWRHFDYAYLNRSLSYGQESSPAVDAYLRHYQEKDGGGCHHNPSMTANTNKNASAGDGEEILGSYTLPISHAHHPNPNSNRHSFPARARRASLTFSQQESHAIDPLCKERDLFYRRLAHQHSTDMNHLSPSIVFVNVADGYESESDDSRDDTPDVDRTLRDGSEKYFSREQRLLRKQLTNNNSILTRAPQGTSREATGRETGRRADFQPTATVATLKHLQEILEATLPPSTLGLGTNASATAHSYHDGQGRSFSSKSGKNEGLTVAGHRYHEALESQGPTIWTDSSTASNDSGPRTTATLHLATTTPRSSLEALEALSDLHRPSAAADCPAFEPTVTMQPALATTSSDSLHVPTAGQRQLSDQRPSQLSSRPARMQRFTRPEDLESLEQDMGHPESTPRTLRGRESSHVHDRQERSRRYIETHTSFLNSADTEGSGYIPDGRTTFSSQNAYHPQQSHTAASPFLQAQTASGTPVLYPSSLADEDGFTAPGTPHSFLSSPSLGYYSHTSRPSSRTGYWVDQGASSLNLIMPSSAMFVKSREPTIEGDKMGFMKMMITGRSRQWNARFIQEIFKWEGIIANDFDDEFLQERPMAPLASTRVNVTSGTDTTSTEYSSDPSSLEASSTSIGPQGEAYSRTMTGSHATPVTGSSEEQSVQSSDSFPQRRQDMYPGATEAIVERFASSTVLPAWARAGFDEQELHQEILVKNICVVDTPGYISFNSPQRALDLIISYIGLQFQTTNEFFSRSAVSDDSLGRFLANNTTGAHSHVDLCFYLIEEQLTDIDLQMMQRLQSWVNLVPVLIPAPSTASTHAGSAETGMPDITEARQKIIQQLRDNDIAIYGMEGSQQDTPSSYSSPMSTANVPDEELTPPPLSLDSQTPVPIEIRAPPFVYYPGDFKTDSSGNRLDMDVQRLGLQRETVSNTGAQGSRSTTQPYETSSKPTTDMTLLRQWVYVHHLAALRHHTTLKFLAWRRQTASSVSLSPMDSSQESVGTRQRLYSNQLYLVDNTAVSTTSNSVLPSVNSMSGALPTEMVDRFRNEDQQRFSAKVTRMVESHRQEFTRILEERREAWQLALAGLEREQRIEFLVQELRRWATEVSPEQSSPQGIGEKSQRASSTEPNTNLRGHVVGLGLGQSTSNLGSEPSMRDALGEGNATRSNRRRTKERKHHVSMKESAYPSVLSQQPERAGGQENKMGDSHSRVFGSRYTETCETMEDSPDGDDPLGLGTLMSRFFGALGRQLVHMVVMVGMGSFATWLYTHFLENRVTWID
ncbi:hypothetical protein BGW38_000715 [Lunasporangiospora selenospora]|uniref:Septin-type G domain-containing protein n=1 Tax=Lunasporangiospora selenospora TaxID=979761 RepID=A0A9P6FUW8_9FUNG|nr:hypothetical protein BGW38_000715 [Lunasporangiospora selenospora]